MSIIERLVSVYAPHACLGCGREGLLLCNACSGDLLMPEARCYRCHADSPSGRTCPVCRQQSALLSVNCAVQYDGLAKDLVWKLKFERAQAAADIMGRLLANQYAAAFAGSGNVLIVPVPTATSRVRKRGYDQAELLARSLARHSGRKHTPLLMRLGKQEQKGAGRQQRHEQLQGALVVRSASAAMVHQARIILVDDVLTTGATLEEAATVLRAAGARAIGGLVFARV